MLSLYSTGGFIASFIFFSFVFNSSDPAPDRMICPVCLVFLVVFPLITSFYLLFLVIKYIFLLYSISLVNHIQQTDSLLQNDLRKTGCDPSHPDTAGAERPHLVRRHRPEPVPSVFRTAAPSVFPLKMERPEPCPAFPQCNTSIQSIEPALTESALF